MHGRMKKRDLEKLLWHCVWTYNTPNKNPCLRHMWLGKLPTPDLGTV